MDRLARGRLTGSAVMTMALFQAASVLAFQSAQSPRERTNNAGTSAPETVVATAMRTNPITAPYNISATWEKGVIVLSGRVGTSVVHDLAVRTVIALGYPVRDDLVIDTAEAHRVALARTAVESWPPQAQPAWAGSAPYFVYPPPLFGRVDDPFFGFEPPLVSFPPWAGGSGPAPGLAPGMPVPPRRPGAAPQSQLPVDLAPAKGDIRLTVDAGGQVFLSGVVASEEDRRIIESEARNTPGVSRVYSELQVVPRNSETPPPPPQPYLAPEAESKPAPPRPELEIHSEVPGQTPGEFRGPRPAAGAPRSAPAELALARDGQKLTLRVAEALSRCAPLAGLPISVQSRGDTVSLSGKVPSAYEAMLAYRAVEQTPGVREIADLLQFQLPDENHPNPLRQKGRPEDIEAYLLSQIRRHVGDLAHVDQIRIRGDLVEIRGSLARDDDRNRVAAILRSMPLLRDFRLESTLVAQ
ncbi:MAG: BON domain-containing protein [Isosphaeraceae bacterium]